MYARRSKRSTRRPRKVVRAGRKSTYVDRPLSNFLGSVNNAMIVTDVPIYINVLSGTAGLTYSFIANNPNVNYVDIFQVMTSSTLWPKFTNQYSLFRLNGMKIEYQRSSPESLKEFGTAGIYVNTLPPFGVAFTIAQNTNPAKVYANPQCMKVICSTDTVVSKYFKFPQVSMSYYNSGTVFFAGPLWQRTPGNSISGGAFFNLGYPYSGLLSGNSPNAYSLAMGNLRVSYYVSFAQEISI